MRGGKVSIKISVISQKNNNDEYSAALKLETIFKQTIPQSVNGEIIIYPSATLYGQTVKDIDIMVIGYLENCNFPLNIYSNGGKTTENIYIKNFCTVVEIKSHDSSGIKRSGTNWFVKYGVREHNVTEQSNQQKYSAKNYFQSILGKSPYITNIIWFTELTENEYISIASHKDIETPTNVLYATFGFSDFVQKLINQMKINKNEGNFIFDCDINYNGISILKNTLDIFKESRKCIGELTRKKIELITNRSLIKYDIFDDEKLTIFRGRAGTGKTIQLIQTAIKLVDEEHKRVLILTYNHALVSDIRRLFSLASLPDMFEGECVSIMTMHSYMYQLIKKSLYDDTLNMSIFLEKYDFYLQKMHNFITTDDTAVALVKEICKEVITLNWEYLLIDEAQDWNSTERDIVLKIFDSGKLLVADGGRQFVRKVNPCDWNIDDKKSIKLKYCLRQKRNLIKFINHFYESLDARSNTIIGSEKMIGGKILLITNKDRLYSILRSEIEKLKYSGNSAYDMLFLVSSKYVIKESGCTFFKLYDEFIENNICVWDGTMHDLRMDFPINPDEARVLQYESARGLEGWTVCLMGFDKWLERKAQEFDNTLDNNPLFLESSEDKLKNHIVNWSTIPLTRAIDTLIITLDDKNSFYSKILLQVANACIDYVEIV